MASGRQVQPRRDLPIGPLILVVGTVGLVLMLVGSGRGHPVSAQPNGGQPCGSRATGWSNATVNGFQGTVREVTREPDLMGGGTPAAAERLVVTLALTNQSGEVIPLAGGTTVAVVTCDGDVLSPNAGSTVDPALLTMEPGAELDLTFTFILTPGIEPERIVVRRTDGDRCIGQLGFPMTIRDSAAVTPTIAANQPTPAATAFASCDGGLATTGAWSSGTSGADGVDAADGASGHSTPSVIPRGSVSTSTAGDSGTATGGRGCDGEDAVGANATGGDGGDGGNAVAGTDSAEVVGADCTPEADSRRPSAMTS